MPAPKEPAPLASAARVQQLGRPEALQAQRRSVPNPFVPSTYARRPPLAYRLCSLLSGLLLVPVRLPLFLLAVAVAVVFATLATAGCTEVNAMHFSHVRKTALFVVRMCTRLMLWSLGFLFIRTRGTPAPRALAPIVTPNHRGFLDSLWLYWAFPYLSFVSAEEHLHIPLLSRLVKAAQTITVRRSHSASRNKARQEINRYSKSSDQMPQVCIFPEGTTTSGCVLLSFKSGAFEPGVPVQPILLRYPNKYLDVSWLYGNGSILSILFRLFASPFSYMEVVYLPPIAPTAAELMDPKAFAQRVQSTMAAALGVSVSEHTSEDTVLQGLAYSLGLPAHSGVIEFGALEHVYGLDRSTAKLLVKEFARLVAAADDESAGGGKSERKFATRGSGGDGKAREGEKAREKGLEAVYQDIECAVGTSAPAQSVPGGLGAGRLSVQSWAASLCHDGSPSPPPPSAALVGELSALASRLGVGGEPERATLELADWVVGMLELRAQWLEREGSQRSPGILGGGAAGCPGGGAKATVPDEAALLAALHIAAMAEAPVAMPAADGSFQLKLRA